MAHVVEPDFRERRQAPPGGEKARRIDVRLVARLKRQLAEIGAHRLAGRHAEVGETAHVVEDVLTRVVLRDCW